jgi:hypothetical protein
MTFPHIKYSLEFKKENASQFLNLLALINGWAFLWGQLNVNLQGIPNVVLLKMTFLVSFIFALN